MTKVQRIIALYEQGLNNGQIALRVGCTPSYVSQALKGKTAISYMKEAAEMRNLTLNDLRNRLLDIIARDRLVDAILDDAQ